MQTVNATTATTAPPNPSGLRVKSTMGTIVIEEQQFPETHHI